jgi:alpha-mannosidase
LSTSLPALGALHTDMLENVQGQLPLDDGKISLDFHPFEVKTVRLRRHCIIDV